jgi:Zn-dependent metalloprotease
MSRAAETSINCITPPHLLRKLLESDDARIREAALSTLVGTATLRGERQARAALAGVAIPGGGRRTIFDCQNGTFLPLAVIVRTEDGPESKDESANNAYHGLGITRDFYRQVYARDSIDGNGMRLDAYIHRGVKYNNAFWNGQQMVFGDGDEVVFTDFTGSTDVIAHELTHGVTEFTANLEYHIEPGALNESVSDVFGSLVKQYSMMQTADQADWLIGNDIFTPGIEADALRSLKAPGTAYDNQLFGRDPQPDHMRKFVHLPDTEEGDNGGVHINSGIPNKAFYLTALSIGGYAWEAPGHIWYESLKASNEKTKFQEFADTTSVKAGELYGSGSAEQGAVVSAWREVGIEVSRQAAPRGGRAMDGPDTLSRKLDALSEQVRAIAKDVAALKSRK